MTIDQLSKADSEFLNYLRGLSIFLIIFGHIGGLWVFRPYSEFLNATLPLFFFISGAVSFNSFNRSQFKTYYIKRLAGLLTPYYLVCVLSLLVYLVMNKAMPPFDLGNLLKWIQIRPTDNTMPFPIGQIWFLHVLVIIILVSPLYFVLRKRNEHILVILMLALMLISGLQLFKDIDNLFLLMGNNFYQPIVSSSFFIFGIIWVSNQSIRNIKFLVFLFASSLILSIFLVYLLKLNIDYAFHVYAPDLYFVSGSFSVISVFLLCKNFFVSAVKINRYVEKTFLFFNRHTFSIFLLHSIPLYLSEKLLGLIHPQNKIILYGVAKLLAVTIVTCIMAIPFTKLSAIIISNIINLFNGSNKTGSATNMGKSYT